MTKIETYLIVSEDGVVLDRVHSDEWPHSFGHAIKIAQNILAQQHGNVLFIDDDQGRRWGRLERIEDWCWSYIPTDKEIAHD